ncbi:hypothetical protein ACIQNU_02585 [Streptomyces sp. NPDC091292]|uniref:hypothetical protein n=1 Tax=Streptomyces sp. NPDC091292 TaxID=3365991 RepID=UPI003807642E
MERASGARATTTAGGTILLGGAALTLYGVTSGQAAHSLGGLAGTLVGLTAIILSVIHGWVTDTRSERIILAAVQREAQAERSRYIAAQAALENEQARLNRDAAAERARARAGLAAEREAMKIAFEEERAKLVCETFEAAVQMVRHGQLDDQPVKSEVVIQFPTQQPERSGEHSRSRERGVVGP